MNIDDITIEELKAKNKRLKDECSKFLSENTKYEKTIKKLRLQIKEIQDQLKSSIEETNHYKNLYLNKDVKVKPNNERGAGRKSKFTEKEVKKIKEAREYGKTIKEIAIEFNCSIGLVHKLINEK